MPIAEPIVFTGNGSKDTPDFHISSSQFTIAWTTSCEQGLFEAGIGLLSIYVYPSGEMTDFAGAAMFMGVGTDSTVIRAGPGDFWLSIISSCSWTIGVKT